MDWIISLHIEQHLKQTGAVFSHLPIKDQLSVAHALESLHPGEIRFHSLENGNSLMICKGNDHRYGLVPADELISLIMQAKRRREDAVSEK